MAIGIPFILWVMVSANNFSLTHSAMTHVVTPLTQAFEPISAVVSRRCFEASSDKYFDGSYFMPAWFTQLAA